MCRAGIVLSFLILTFAACRTIPLREVGTRSTSPSIGIGIDLTPTLPPIQAATQSLTATIGEDLTPTGVETPQLPATVPVASLRATVLTSLLSCRYGPGADYLYLYALRSDANITLIGRTDGDNWSWVWVDGRQRCWVNAQYLRIDGDWHQLPIVYPGEASLPPSRYYPPPTIISAIRDGQSVTVKWTDVPVRVGDQEDGTMQPYILETWLCRNAQLIFEPFATEDTSLLVTDDAGCSAPSHARLFLQEKHGFSGPVEIPWPPP